MNEAELENWFPWGWHPPLTWDDCHAANPHERCGGCDACLSMQHEGHRLLAKEQAQHEPTAEDMSDFTDTFLFRTHAQIAGDW